MASDAEVLIVGAGIAGLSLARALTLVGRTVEVIERAGEWSIEGSGLGLYPNALRALDTLGLAGEIRASGHEVRAVRYFDRRGNLLAELTPPWAGLDQPYVEIRRRALHDVLIEGADVPIRMGTTVTHLERSPDALVVTLSDQTTATYRLVVGAEGVYSTRAGARRLGRASLRRTDVLARNPGPAVRGRGHHGVGRAVAVLRSYTGRRRQDPLVRPDRDRESARQQGRHLRATGDALRRLLRAATYDPRANRSGWSVSFRAGCERRLPAVV